MSHGRAVTNRLTHPSASCITRHHLQSTRPREGAQASKGFYTAEEANRQRVRVRERRNALADTMSLR